MPGKTTSLSINTPVQLPEQNGFTRIRQASEHARTASKLIQRDLPAPPDLQQDRMTDPLAPVAST